MPRKTKRTPQTITPEQLNKILDIIVNQPDRVYPMWEYTKFRGLRESLAILMMYYMGLRPKEAIFSRIDYLDFDKKSFFIPAMSNKQRNEDFVPIPDLLINPLKSYILMVRRFFPNTPYLFPSQTYKGTTPIHVSSVAHTFRKALKKVGLHRVNYLDTKGDERATLTIYNLRISFATYVYEKTHDFRKVGLALRHRDRRYRTVYRYIATLENSFENRQQVFNEVFNDFHNLSQIVL